MRIEHRLPSDLVRRGPVRVLIVGVGGTGSTIAMNLPYLDQAMRVWGHANGLDVTMMDADTVSATNCVRQPFSASDIGQNKATVLINRINIFWGTKWAAIPNRFHARSFDRHRDPRPGCRDQLRRHTRSKEDLSRIVYSRLEQHLLLAGPWQQRCQWTVCSRPAIEREKPAQG